MRVPPIDNRPTEWAQPVIDSWRGLTERAQGMVAEVGESDAFEQMLATFRGMVSAGRFDGLRPLLRRRLAARALTWLWLNDQTCGQRLLNVRMLDSLLESQSPRLTRLTLVQLIQLYFRFFDHLDERDQQGERSLHERLQEHLLDQLERIPAQARSFPRKDVISVLKTEGQWLLCLDGPSRLVRHIHEQGVELPQAFMDFGLEGFDTGRYGDICRAHYYLETLRSLLPGEWHPVLDELLKPSVSKAPYQGDKRIGHAALEIMIDRAGDGPGDAWQNFIITLAGDPRIASSAANYREWWRPLGEARISKVRGWLSKEDLRLFLQAVEQYGIETRNTELQRMFPARKVFLEGLFKLKLIRNTRLLLGSTAQQSVNRILGGEVKTSFARMDGTMADKAVIYLDCGEFYLVEGSHNFRVWIYLAEPGNSLRSYDKTTFGLHDLIRTVPADYQKLYPQLPHEAVTHGAGWQGKVIRFLANHGIGLDVEALFTPADYRIFLRREGIPYVNPNKVNVPLPQESVERTQQEISVSIPLPMSGGATPSPVSEPLAQPVLAGNAASKVTVSAISAAKDNQEEGLSRPASSGTPLVASSTHKQSLDISEESRSGQPAALPRLTVSSQGVTKIGAEVLDESDVEFVRDIGQLSHSSLNIIRYFARNPGDKARYAGNVLGMDVREVNRLLYGPLSKLCNQDKSYGWSVFPEVAEILRKLFP